MFMTSLNNETFSKSENMIHPQWENYLSFSKLLLAQEHSKQYSHKPSIRVFEEHTSPLVALIVNCDYQKVLTTGQTDTWMFGQTDAGQDYSYKFLCLDRQHEKEVPTLMIVMRSSLRLFAMIGSFSCVLCMIASGYGRQESLYPALWTSIMATRRFTVIFFIARIYNHNTLNLNSF